MKTYLVLGARAPAALEISRGLSRGGHRVLAADSMRMPITRWSRHVSGYHRLPSPVMEPARYGKALADIVYAERVDCVIPTCEEVFHLSMARSHIPDTCIVLADDIGKLRSLHDKFTFMSEAKDCGIGIPRTMLLRSRRRLADSWERVMTDHDIVYKRTFSRFAEGTLVKPSLKEIDKVYPSLEKPWVAQEFIDGDEVCCYAVAVDGRPTAIAPYVPLHRAGKGAGICFAPAAHEQIENFVTEFVGKQRFTGQISFDFIVSPDRGAFVIECNPRATSGVHLLPRDTDWAGVFDGSMGDVVRPDGRQAMVGAAMATFGLSASIYRRPVEWLRDISGSKDVVWEATDPMPAAGQFLATAETLARAVREGITPLAATTSDIEWNGGDIAE